MPRVHISGMGVDHTVVVESGDTIAVAIEKAGSALPQGLVTSVNGEGVDPTQVEVQGDTEVTLTPPNVKLGA